MQAAETFRTHFKGLRYSWQRIQQLQLREYKELDLEAKDLVRTKTTSRRISEGPTTQVSTAGPQEPITHSSAIPLKELAREESNRAFRRSSRKRSRNGKRYGKVCHKAEHEAQDLPDAQSDRRGPPTDRPPDKPPPWKGAFTGSSYEMATFRHVSQLASSRGTIGLSGNASPMEKIHLRVKWRSNQWHASAAGSSQGSHPVRSWSFAGNAIMGKSRHQATYCVHAVGSSHEINRGLSWTSPRCARFRVNGIRVRALCRPSPNLGRNLFPPRRFSYHTRFSRFNGTACQPT
jgi:hypothetical protein